MLLRNQLYAGIVDVPEYGVRAKRGEIEPPLVRLLKIVRGCPDSPIEGAASRKPRRSRISNSARMSPLGLRQQT
jgi:hypothetical protein